MGVVEHQERIIQVRTLIVEDDFTSRILLQSFLSAYGECDIAVNGREAVEAFSSARERGQSYDLICMDIMMPEMEGHASVRAIRALEEATATLSPNRVKIIMATALDDGKNAIESMNELWDAYLVKPIHKKDLLDHIKDFHLV